MALLSITKLDQRSIELGDHTHIALNLSGLGEDQVAINLRTEQPGDAYKASIPGSWCRRWTSVVPC